MSDVQSTIISSLAKVIDSAQSGYAPKGLPSRVSNEAQSHNITLTVLSAKNNQILLEEQVSGKKLLIDKSALQGASIVSLARGDSLVLVSSNSKYATFVVERNSQQSPNKLAGQALQNVSHSLSLQWPDVPANIIKKAHPVILNQLQLATNTQQAKNLANSIIAIAAKTGQPILAVNTTATVALIDAKQTTIDVNAQNVSGIRLNIDAGNKQAITLTIPLTSALSQGVVTELKSKLFTNQQLSLSVDVNSKNGVLTNIRQKGQSKVQLSALAIKEINSALTGQFQQIKQHLSPLVLSPHSPNLHSGIAIAPTEQNLQALGPVIKLQITNGISKQALQSTRILLGQNPQNNNKIQISLVDKPVTLGILNSQLADAKINDSNAAKNNIIQQIHNTNASTTISQNGKVQATASSIYGLTEQPSKALHKKLIEILTLQGNTPSAITSKLANLQSAIYSEMNQVLPRSENMGSALPSILSQLQSIGKGAGPELKHLIAQVSMQIKNSLPGTESISGSIPTEFSDSLDEIALSPESRQIKDLLTTPTLPNINGAPIQSINGVNSQSSLVNGLVAMLQASLQAKLIAQQPQLLSTLLQSSQFTQLIPKMMGLSKNTNAQSKILQDLSRLDPKSNLIGELNKVLSNHSLHKLSGAESSLQNQDSFYYTLPNMFSPQHKDIEIVIKREQQAQREKDQKVQQAWQLSMKLDIGESGEVLAKVKLLNENVDLNLYASNQLLKEKILDNLPYLNRRLESLGLSVKPQCYLGKIPNTLHKTDYQVVQTYV